MRDDMGTFRTDVEIENPSRRGERRLLHDVLVDTGAELSWIPAEVLEALGVSRDKRLRFRQANGPVLERWTGIAIVHAGGTFTGDDVVFGEPGGDQTACRCRAGSRGARAVILMRLRA